MSDSNTKNVPKKIETLDFFWSTLIPQSEESWTLLDGDHRLRSDPSIEFLVFMKRIEEPASLHLKISKKTNACAHAKFDLELDERTFASVEMCDWTDEDCLFNNLELPKSRSEDVESIPYDLLIRMDWFGCIEKEKNESPLRCTIQAERLLLNENFSDAVLKIGDNKLPVHKIVLALQSPVFESVFTTPMKESIENCVIIEDVELIVMKELLKYLYTGELVGCNDFTIVSKIFQAADKYQIDKLKHLCEKKLVNNLAADNVLHILVLAYCHDSAILHLKSLEFIITKRKILLPCVSWMENLEQFCLEKPALAYKIMEAMFDVL